MNPRIEYYINGNKKCEYYYNGLIQLHNELGPAVIKYNECGNKSFDGYYINNERHNAKGAARIFYHQNGKIIYKEYWINNEQLKITSDEEFQKYIKRLSIS